RSGLILPLTPGRHARARRAPRISVGVDTAIRYKPGGRCLGTEGWMRRCLTSAAALALIFAAEFGAASSALAQQGQRAAASASLAGDLGWPRDFDVGNDQLEVYQPQIETWQGDRMSGRMAIAVGLKSGSPIYGVAHFSARATVDKTAGTVTLGSITISKVD